MVEVSILTGLVTENLASTNSSFSLCSDSQLAQNTIAQRLMSIENLFITVAIKIIINVFVGFFGGVKDTVLAKKIGTKPNN
ncbi:MAG: hypothetical protein ACJAS3_002349 [Roseivirga sp.]|jgi:hypothetical protein